MKKTNPTIPVSAGFCMMVLLLAQSGTAQTVTPVFDYTFPASWGGSGTAVTDQSAAGNNGQVIGTLSLDAAPPSSSGNSINTGGRGGINTLATGLLNNSAVASAGGFTMSSSFLWNGGTTSWSTQKIIDYAGTESLQLNSITAGTSASLQMSFANNAGVESIPVSTTILPNTWYNVSLTFNTIGNSIDGNGDISGTADLYLNGVLVASGGATKGTYGDTLNRPIGVGELGLSPYGSLVYLAGDVYDPSVGLGVVPEPSTLALSLMGGVGALGAMYKARRRKA